MADTFRANFRATSVMPMVRELKETFDALRDAVDRGYLQQAQIVPLQRLSRRASKAATGLIKYLRTAKPPNDTPPRSQ
jgi:hypothetical protein